MILSVSGGYHSTIPQYREHEDAVVQACTSETLFALQSHHILHQQTPSMKNVLRVRPFSKSHLLSVSSFSINGEYSVADDLGPYLHNTEQAQLSQLITQDWVSPVKFHGISVIIVRETYYTWTFRQPLGSLCISRSPKIANISKNKQHMVALHMLIHQR